MSPLPAARIRIALALLLLTVGFAPAASAAMSTFKILLDLDNHINTGCDVPTLTGTFKGAEQILVTTVTTTGSSAQVTSLAYQSCTVPATNTFGPLSSVPAPTGLPWTVGPSNGTGGTSVIETYYPLSLSPVTQPPIIRLGVLALDDGGILRDELVKTQPTPGNGPPILLNTVNAVAVDIPTLSEWALILLGLLLAATAVALLRQRTTTAFLLALMLLGAAGIAWAAAGVGDLNGGTTNEWMGTLLASDMTGDAPAGTDIWAFYGFKGTDDALYFRIDAQLLFDVPPIAVNDSYNANEDTPLNVPTLGVLVNDSVNGGTISAFDNSSVQGGTVVLNADGSFTYTPPAGFAGTDSFGYTLTNAAGSSSATVTITVAAVNHAPVPSGGPFSLPENSANGTVVGTVLPNDPDTGQTHTWSILSGNTGGAFAIDGSGQITVANSGALDFETTLTFNLTVQATDNGTPALSGSTTVVVNLTNVNEVPMPSGGPFSLPENSANGTVVGTVLPNDPDTGQTHTWSILSGNTGGAFAIDGSGQITVANSGALDLDTTPTFNLTVQATDNGTPALSGSTTVVVNLTDGNDAPMPSGGPFSLPENSANGTVVGTVLPNDPDTGQTHTWSILSGNTGGAFAIDGSGQITVANSGALDFETTLTFNLTVQATDNGTPALSGSTTVVVNLTNVNEVPMPSGGPFSLPENSANGTMVGTVLPNDPDTGQTHTWSILSGNTGGAFAIDSSGQITVANSGALDLETTPTFNLTVQATDNGTPALSGSTTVVVNLTDGNDAPMPSGGPFALPENSANGTVVGTVLPNDPDTGQTHTWSILSGNTGGAFAIDGSGQITVANSGALDFETTPTFNLTVQATDNGTPALSGSTTVVVNLTNGNDAPIPSGGPFSLPENSANGTVVGTVLPNDPDTGQTHTWSILSGNTGGAFAIDGSGQITVANSGALDFETTPTFNLTVQATDNGTPALSGSTTVVVNLTNGNDAPMPSGGPFSLPENSANGTVVGTVLPNDPDTGQTHTWSILSGNTGGAFAIDGSGQITVANSGALDFETTPTFNLTVQATDNGTPVLSGSTPVVVNLTNVNEVPMPSGGPFSLPENSANGTVAGTVLPNDPDTGQTHTWSILSGNTGGAFAIDGSGQITVANSGALNFETTPTFNLTVQATDNGTPALSGSTLVVVNLTNVNEVPMPSGGPFSISENSANGTVVGTVLPNDPDTGQTHTWSILSGNTGGAFAIDGSGQITVANSGALNFETTPTFNLTVQATDNGTPALSGSTTVVVNLTNINEVPMPSGGPFSLPENSANGTVVGTVLPNDPDTGQTHTWSILSGNTGGAFAIDGSGQITVANSGALDFETTPTFNLTVQATDNGTPALSGSTTVVVNLTNVNDAPMPSGGPFSLPENSVNGTVVGTVLPNDPDTGQTHMWSILSGNTGGAFAIDGSGQITVANSGALNFETTPAFNLTVQATDNGTPVLSGSTPVVVNLTNVNEVPMPSGGPFSLPENSANGTVVGTVLPNDPDTGQTHMWSILSGNTGGAFAIDGSGQITVANSGALDFETTPTFNLTVQATDNGTPALSGSTLVVVNLLNVPEAPVAGDDGTPTPFETIGNTLLEFTASPSVPEPKVVLSGNLLSNDFDPDGPTTFTVALNSASPGAVVTVNGDGTFTYLPPPNFVGDDTFTYKITDTTMLSDTATVTIRVKSRVWYVRNDATAGGLGRSTDPFDTLAEAETASGAGDTIFVYFGDGTTTGQNAGILLKANQRLLGEGVKLDVPVIVNGGPNPTVLRNVTGSQPLLDRTTGGGECVRGNNVGGLEIRGLSLTGSVNAIDLTTTGGNSGGAIIRNNTIRGAGAEGIDINAGGGGTMTLDIQDNTWNVAGTHTGNAVDIVRTAGTMQLNFSNNMNILSANAAGAAVNISGGAIASTTITGFSGNTVHGNTAGAGILVSNATFDQTPGGTFQTVSGGTTTVGSVGNGVGTAGMVLTSVAGDLSFSNLLIVASGGAGLQASGLAPYNNSGPTGVGFQITLANTAATKTVTATGGPAVSLTTVSANLPSQIPVATQMTVTSTSSATTGVALNSVTGVFSADSSSSISNITSAAGTAFQVGSSSATVNYDGTINTSTGKGVDLTSNSGSISFTGALTISSGTNTAFNATGGGTVTSTNTSSTLTTGTGTALNVANTTIGIGGIKFKNITSTGGANPGIILNNTGSSGGLTVTGTIGVNNSGGIIQNKTGDSINLANTRNVSLTEMRIASSGQNHIDATSVTNLTLNSMELDSSASHGILGNGITNLTINGGTFNRGGADGEPTCNLDGVNITNLLGTSSITGATFTRSNTRQFFVTNTTNSGLDTLTVSGTTWGTHTGPCSGDHLSILADTGSNFKLIANSSSGENNFTTGGIAIQAAATGSGTMQASITGVDASGNTAGVAIAATTSSNISFDVYDNRTALGTGFSGTGSVALIMTCTTSGVCQGAFRNNSVTHTAGTSTNAMQVVVEGNGTGRVTISGNSISGNCQRCLHAQSRSGTGSLSLHVTNNSFTATDATGLQVVNIEAGASGGGTTNSICLNLASNTSTPAGAMSAYRLLHRTGYTYQLQDLVQASTTNTADVQTWVTTTKSNTGTPVSVTVGASPFTTSAGCTTPTLPTP